MVSSKPDEKKSHGTPLNVSQLCYLCLAQASSISGLYTDPSHEARGKASLCVPHLPLTRTHQEA